MPVPYKPKPKSTNMGEKIVKTEVRKAQMSKPSPKPKPVSEADKKKAEQLKKSYEARKKSELEARQIAKSLEKINPNPKDVKYQISGGNAYVTNDPKLYTKYANRQDSLAKKDSIGAVKLNPDVFKKKK